MTKKEEPVILRNPLDGKLYKCWGVKKLENENEVIIPPSGGGERKW